MCAPMMLSGLLKKENMQVGHAQVVCSVYLPGVGIYRAAVSGHDLILSDGLGLGKEVYIPHFLVHLHSEDDTLLLFYYTYV